MSELVIPWLDKLSKDDFITSQTPYTEGKYFHLFDEKEYETNDSDIGKMRYYVFDPTKHGYPSDAKYPVIYSFHGMSASLQGKTAINWAGVEWFASPEYQEKMGGAYIICPLANEYILNDEVKLSWMTPLKDSAIDCNKEYSADYLRSMKEEFGESASRLFELLGTNSIYTKHLKGLYDEAVSSFSSSGKTIVFGISAGGYCAWRYIISYKVDAALVMAPSYLPSFMELDILDKFETKLWICQGRNDECVPFDFSIAPILDKLNTMSNVEIFLPELVRMPNYGVYSNPAGIEMGQHCINNAVQCDLMYDDGKPMDEAHPEGVTGWIKKVAG